MQANITATGGGKKEKIRQKLGELEGQYPFYFFKPNDGVLTESGKSILARYLKPEDIPQRVDSQLDAILSDAAITGISGGNRSSKTTAAVIWGIIRATGELPVSFDSYKSQLQGIIDRAKSKTIKGRVFAVDAKQLHRVVIPEWQKWMPKQFLKKDSWEESYSRQFDILTLYRNGKPCATIEFMTYAQETKSGQGNDLDFAVFDEEPDRDKYKETLMRFGTADRLDVLIAWTPTEGLTWATDLFHTGMLEDEEVTEDRKLFKLTTVCNRAVNHSTIIRIMDEFSRVSSYDEMRMRLLGEAISLSGLVYGGLFDERMHVISPFSTKCNCGEYAQDSGHSSNCPVSKYFVRVGVDPHLVTPTAVVFVGVDRFNNKYVFNSYVPKLAAEMDTEEVKKAIHRIAKENNYRWGQTVVDKSANSDIEALGGLNIFRELSTGKNALKGVMTSEKHDGSIKAGVDEIKKHLKPHEISKKPTLFIFNTPENKALIQSFRTLERDTYTNEEKRGQKDRIMEGKHHLHAALRYTFQHRFNWVEPITLLPEPTEERYI